MKYSIPQDKLDKIVFRYLDMEYGNLEKVEGAFGDMIFRKSESDGYMGWWWKQMSTLYLYYKIINDTSWMFSMEESDAKEAIGRWIQDRYKLDIDKIIITYSGI